MNITSVKVWPLKNSKGKSRAFASFVLDEELSVSCTIMQGEKSLWVKLPSHKGKDKEGNEKWYDDVMPITKEARAELTEKVLTAYHAEVGNSPTNQASSDAPSNQAEAIPFG